MLLRRLPSSGIAALALVVAAGAAAAQDTVWTQQYSGFGPLYGCVALAIATTPDSAVVVTGYSKGSDGSRDVVTWKYSQRDGQPIWNYRWWGGSYSDQEGRAVAVDDSGNVFVVGTECHVPPDTDFMVIKSSRDNDTVFRTRFVHPGADAAVALVPDRHGGVFVTGWSNPDTTNSNRDFVTMHYDAGGNVRWTARLNGVGNSHDVPTAIALDDSGRLYVTGYSWTGTAPQYDYLTARLDTTNGETLWTRLYDGTAPVAPKDDRARAIAFDDSQYVYVTGQAGEQGTWYDGTTVKYTPAGGLVWVNRFDPGMNGTDGASHIGVDANFNVYCAGWTWDDNDWPDYLVYRINQQGGTIENPWFRSYDGGVEDEDSLTAAVVDRLGNVYVSGRSYVFAGDLDIVTFKYDAQGQRLWTASYRDPDQEDDIPSAMAMDRYGDLYVTGYAYDPPDERYITIKYTEADVGAFRVVLPNDSFRIGATVTPKAWIRNYGALTSQTFPVRFEVGHVYLGSVMSGTIPPHDSVLVTFSPSWQVAEDAIGTNEVRCYTMLDGDKEVSNDTTRSQVTGVRAWERLPDIPVGPANKGVKDGGALGFAADMNVYAFKGNNRYEFYEYNAQRDSWSARESIPAGAARKKVKAGAQLAGDTSGNVYAFKGNNTLEFWMYSVAGRTWTQQPDYPVGAGKRLKGGSNLAFVAQRNALYGCKGNNTPEFNSYDIAAGAWVPKSPVPTGQANKKPKDGTAIAYDGVGTVYLLKGGTYEFYGYSIARDSWYEKKPIRNSQYSTKKRKMKKGASGAFDPEFNRFYALKGGKSGEFWFFDVARDTWVEAGADSFPTPPGTKLPYAGADICYGAGKIYALRGNKTFEFWRYNANLPLEFGGYSPGPQAGNTPLPRLRFAVAPNPFAGRTQFRYALPAAGRVRLVLYDAAGRLARVVQDGWQERGEHVLALQSEGLAAGVYVARLTTQNEATVQEVTHKVLVTR